ncbi:hypothetical protein [Spirosoma profusum]|uniref:hypothetical protein n=1 Tax=Spirosoma profusum TaxID=2771354 RepID=UPI0016843E2A|nr:hypothetical protein [Spirosoma profusum]
MNVIYTERPAPYTFSLTSAVKDVIADSLPSMKRYISQEAISHYVHFADNPFATHQLPLDCIAQIWIRSLEFVFGERFRNLSICQVHIIGQGFSTTH